jgi:hypothetical protein
LNKLDKAYPDFVITSTDEGLHCASSLHYADAAFDVRKRAFAGSVLMIGSLEKICGPEFDVIEEGDHFHIEYEGERK